MVDIKGIESGDMGEYGKIRELDTPKDIPNLR